MPIILTTTGTRTTHAALTHTIEYVTLSLLLPLSTSRCRCTAVFQLLLLCGFFSFFQFAAGNSCLTHSAERSHTVTLSFFAYSLSFAQLLLIIILNRQLSFVLILCFQFASARAQLFFFLFVFCFAFAIYYYLFDVVVVVAVVVAWNFLGCALRAFSPQSKFVVARVRLAF